jgi:hypothetical protein
MARSTVKTVQIKGVDYIASIASNDDNNLRSAYLTPKFVVDANLDAEHPDFWNHINSEIDVCRLVDATDDEILAMIDAKIELMQSDSLESFF